MKEDRPSKETCRRVIYEIEEITPTEQEYTEALEHHLKQLKEKGAALEDDICQVLRKSIKAEQLKKSIKARSIIISEREEELLNESLYWNIDRLDAELYERDTQEQREPIKKKLDELELLKRILFEQ